MLAAVLGVIAWNMPGKWFQADVVSEDLPTIVVLPLVDMSVGQNERALCDGLTEELSNWLAHIPTLRVVARTSAFAFKGKNTDVRDIARELGASHVLEGSLRRQGEELRITVQLIEGVDGVHIWSDSYDLPIGDIFGIEDIVARTVAEKLHIELSSEVGERWKERRSDTTNGFELYLLARERQRLRTAEDNLKAEEFFRRAIAADPEFTPALTGLAETLLNGLSLNRAAMEDVKAQVEPLIHRATQLSPNSADVLAVQGWLLNEQLRFDEALPLLEKAVKLNPNDAASHRFLGDLFDRRAQPNEALRHYSAAASLDPLDFISHVFRCIELVDLGAFETAEAACRRARELEPNHMWGALATAWIERARGNTLGALKWLDEARRLAPTDTWLADQKIELLLTLRRHDDARAVMREIPLDGRFQSQAREAAIVYSEGGPPALKAWMSSHPVRDSAGTGLELSELARMQLLSGDPVAARETLEHAQRILKLTPKDLYDGGQIRHEYSAALVHARILLSGGGDRAKAMKLLDDFDALLATYEEHGGEHFGLYSLRAESRALRGDREGAARSLQKAWDRGWRATWRIMHDPFLAGVKLPGH
jgi:TolB-like protein/Flp pilus assembly protein TadD